MKYIGVKIQKVRYEGKEYWSAYVREDPGPFQKIREVPVARRGVFDDASVEGRAMVLHYNMEPSRYIDEATATRAAEIYIAQDGKAPPDPVRLVLEEKIANL